MLVDKDHKLIAKKPMHQDNNCIKFVVCSITLSLGMQVATSGQASSLYCGQDNVTQADIRQSSKLACQSSSNIILYILSFCKCRKT